MGFGELVCDILCNMKKRVIIFEDNDAAIQKMKLISGMPKYKNEFDFELIEYPEDIEKWISDNESSLSNVELFICDHDIHGAKGDSFVRQIRDLGFKGKMLANSSDYNELLLKAGCDLENPVNKDLKVIREILDKSTQENKEKVGELTGIK